MNDTDKALAAAARLLVEIAGPEQVHIEMSARGPKKYYDVHRPLDEKDARAHLLGYRTKGALLRYPNGMTRALCYDADSPQDWQHLLEAARLLVAHGYAPLLEASPVGRGGHCWIIYTAQVKASWARAQVQALAPMLGAITEYWPGVSNYKVRLPGGRYVRPGFAAWCPLTDAHGALLVTDGTSVARVLLDHQTPAELVPAAAPEPASAPHSAAHAAVPHEQHAQSQAMAAVTMGQVDQQWQKKYMNCTLWFQFTPRQLATLYNERHPLADMLPLENNGMAFSPSVQERTPSTAITKDGLAWVDFSARACSPDGKHDGGDALELAARRGGESRGNKARTLREVAREVVAEARDALECAARRGEPPPAWVASIMTEAGWQRYRALRAEVSSVVTLTATRGVTGCSPQGDDQVAFTHPGDRTAQAMCRAQAQQAPLPAHDTPGALAAELGAKVDEPCPRCGCTLSYWLDPYQMCYRCFPRRLTEAQWQRLRALFPCTSLRLALAGGVHNV